MTTRRTSRPGRPISPPRPDDPRPAPDLPSRGETLSAALLYADLGWHVFPLRPEDGRPALHDGWEQCATVDPDQIVDCWSGPTSYGLGIATGPSRLVVIDFGVPHGPPTDPDGDPSAEPSGAGNLLALACRLGEEIPATFTVWTGCGDLHLYYTHPFDGPVLRNTTGLIAPHVDSSAHGGYVVAAPSVVAGHPFVIVDPQLPVPLPSWLRDRLISPPGPEGTPVRDPLGATGEGDVRRPSGGSSSGRRGS